MVVFLDNPFISIILPTYNRPGILRECLISIISQSYKNWELIVIDDCSPLPVEANIKDFIDMDGRIKFFRNVFRRTTPSSKNIGISLAKYDLILILEDDMVLDPDAIKILIKSYLELSEKDPMLGAVAPSIPFVQYEDLKNLGTIKERLMDEKPSADAKPFKMSALTGAMITDFTPKYQSIQEVQNVHACVIYPKKLITEAKGYRENVYKGNFLREETDLSYRLRKCGYHFYFEPRAIFFHVRVHEGGSRINILAYNYYTIYNHTQFLYYNLGLVKTFYMAPLFLLESLIIWSTQFPGFLLRQLTKRFNFRI